MKRQLFALAVAMLSSGLVSTEAFAQLQVGAGAYWNHSGAVYTVLDDMDLVSNGVFSDASGTMKFTGTNSTIVTGGTIPGFYHLEIAKSNTLFLQQDCNIGQDIVFTSGIIDLNGRVVTLSPAAQLVNESETSRIAGTAGGYVTITTVLNAPVGVNPGNLGAELTTTQNPGSTIIRRGHMSQQNGPGNGSSIFRYFDIVPANNTALNATLRLHYFDAELNGLTESSLTAWESPDNTNWTDMGYSGRDVTVNYVDRDLIPDMGRWTLSSPGNALPVVYEFLRARCAGNTTVLEWRTGAEQHSSRFDVERSGDARGWQVVGSMAAAGNSSAARDYGYVDADPPAGGCYYRVVEYDEDGRAQYSPVESSGCGVEGPDRAWPNPCSNTLFVRVQMGVRGAMSVRIYNGAGVLVDRMEREGFAGPNQVEINMGGRPAGVYHVVVEWERGRERRQFEVVKRG